MHVDTDVSPVSALYLPAKHGRHPLEPFSSLYFPLKHAVHSLPSAPVYPALHVQLSMLLLPMAENIWIGQSIHEVLDTTATPVENFPAPHDEQIADPFTSLKVPAAHELHVPPSGPV